MYTLNEKLISVLTCFVDDIAYGNTPTFQSHILDKLKETFHIGTFHSGAFDYIGISVSQNDDHSVCVNQTTFINTIQYIDISHQRLAYKHEPVTDSERTQLRGAIGQLSWAAGISRPDISFAVVS